MSQPIIETLFMMSEYVSGPAQIAGMILAGMRPIIWAPSAFVLDQAFDTGRSILSSRDLLRLVDMGLVRIAARERWLTDRSFRDKYRWEGAKWVSHFDGQVLKWFQDDSGKPVPRVVCLPPEDGTDWALAQRKRQDHDPEAKRRIESARYLLKKGLLPDGLRERANEVYTLEEKENTVLRDIRNTEVARDNLRKPILVTAPYSTDAIATLFEDLTVGRDLEEQQVSPDILAEFADLATSITSGTVKNIEELELRHRRSIEIGLAPLMTKLLIGDKISLSERIANEVRGSQQVEMWKQLFAGLKIKLPDRLTLAGVLAGALSSNVSGDTSGVKASLGRVIHHLIPDSPDREQFRRGLFLIFHGAEKPEYLQMKELRRRLNELARRPRRLSVPVLSAAETASRPEQDTNETEKTRLPKVFISYAHEDLYIVQEFRTCMVGLERNNLISVWFDERLEAGRWDDQIRHELMTSDIVLFFVSDAFLRSDYIMNKEVPETLKRATDGYCHLIPIILSGLDIDTTPFADFTVFPSRARPVLDWDSRADAWDSVIGAIRRTVLTLPRLLSI